MTTGCTDFSSCWCSPPRGLRRRSVVLRRSRQVPTFTPRHPRAQLGSCAKDRIREASLEQSVGSVLLTN